MKVKYLILMTGLFCSLNSSSFAASDAFCDRYAQQGVTQHIRNIAHDCKFTGLRWSADFIGQKNWCKTVRESIANNETAARNTQLTACGVAPNTRTNWATISHYISSDKVTGAAVKRAQVDDVRSLQVFAQEGFDLTQDWFDNWGTPLYHAITKQAELSVHYLIGIDNPNRTTNAGGNPLARLLENNPVNYRLLRFLLRNGAKANISGENQIDSNIPLFVAVKTRNLQAVKELLHVGQADPNFYYDTPVLITALQNKDRDIALQLIYKGANVNDTGTPGCYKPTPLDLALAMNDGALIYTIRQRGGKTLAQCTAGS